jgi:hypothetical protein
MTEVDLVLSRNRLEELSEPQILSLLTDRLAFNVSEWNEQSPHAYHPNDISNLESVLYRCPVCGKESLTSARLALACPDCGETFSYDRFGKIGGFRIDKLYHVQEQAMRKSIEGNPEFCLVSPVKLESYRGKHLETVGEGTLRLNKKEYVYEGTLDGAPVVKRFDPKNIPTLPSDLGRNVQIYEGYVIYQFVMDEVHLPTKFVIAGEIIHNLLREELVVPTSSSEK